MPSETKISFYDGGSTDTLRKYSDDSSRKQLSDHSVVLTEDTDSFIIGDRVWVGGSKPGQIAYIGETQFAPGEWAGIVLDEPIGKNDGSVAGVRYFQCSERRGVFSRLTRLTRAPLVSPRSPHAASPASDAGSVFAASSTPLSSAVRQRRALSPNGSVRSAFSSKMNMSVTSTTGGEVRVGDRVIVSSSQGSKAGILRYYGPTDFAAGVWCGVELDDPIGKNDGSVEGKRYFECSPRFGLFAPASKVSRSPSNRKPGNCAIHSNGRIRRSNSRESLTSLGTSIVSSVKTGASRVRPPLAAQELLREKQQHVERLMRERELERAEVAKVTLQADRARTQLQHAITQSTAVSTENEALKTQISQLSKQLEDERQRAEDLLFRTEEDNIHKEDYNKFKEAAEEERRQHLQRIAELEAEVSLASSAAEASRVAAASATDKHQADVDILMAQHKDEIQAAQMLSTELQKLLDEAYALLKEKESEKDSLSKSLAEELSRARTEAEKALGEARSKLAVAQTEFECQMTAATAKLQLAESKLDAERQNGERMSREHALAIGELGAKLTRTQAVLDDNTAELNKLLGASKEQELSLSKELTKLKIELSSKVADIEDLSESKKRIETACKSLETEIAHVKEDFAEKINEYELLLNETSSQNDDYIAEIKELQQKLYSKTNELEKLSSELKETSATTSKLIREYKDTISERDKEIVKLKHAYEQATANFNKNQLIVAEEHRKLINERNLQIEKLSKEVQQHELLLAKNKIDYDDLTLQANNNVDEIKTLISKNAELNNTVIELNKTIQALNAQISEMELGCSDLERKLNSSNEKYSELLKAKEKVEVEYLNLTSHSTNSSEEMNKLSQHLRATEKELQETRDKLREKSDELDKVAQELNHRISTLKKSNENESDILTTSLAKAQKDLVDSKEKTDSLEKELKSVNDQISISKESNASIQKEKILLEKEINILKTKEVDLQAKFQRDKEEHEKIIDELNKNIAVLKAAGESSEVTLKEKVDQLVEAQNDLNNRLEQAQNNEAFLQKKLEEMTDHFSNEKKLLNSELNEKQTELIKVKEEAINSASQILQVSSEIAEKENAIKELILKLSMLEVDLKSNAEIILEKDRQIAVAKEQLSKICEDKHNVEQKYDEKLSDIKILQNKYESIVSEKTDISNFIDKKQAKIESLVADLQNLTKEKCSLESKTRELTESLNKVSANYEEIVKEINSNKDSKCEFSNILKQKENLMKAENEKYMTNLNKLKAEKEDLLIQLKEKESNLMERETQLSQLKETLQFNNTETISHVQNLETELETLTKKHKEQVALFQKSLNDLEINAKDKDKVLDDLKKKDEQISELQNMLTKAESDIKQITNINESQKTNYEELNKQLQANYDRLKKEGKLERRNLRERLQELEMSLEVSKGKEEGELTKQKELQARFDESSKLATELANKVELLEVRQQTASSGQQALERVTLELQDARKHAAEAVAAKDQLLEKLRTEVENKINDLVRKDNFIQKLDDDLKKQKVKTELLQREKLLAQQEMADKEKEFIIKDQDDISSKDQTDNKISTVCSDEIVEGQVAFLNSVIVDMQRKNEQLLARVHALETGFQHDVSPDQFSFESKKIPAPRLFCDICDVFDAHDTEDCPRQSGEHASAPSVTQTGQRKPPPPPRPYCDICEVFGHTTENCNEEETF